jgi:outer membrane receptor for ferrienterochelin and colicin
MQKFLHLFLFACLIGLLSALPALAQPGTVKGNLKDAASKEALIGASVLLEGTSFGGAADVEGNYVINKVPSGTYTAVVSFLGYKTLKVPGIVVEPGKITLINTALEEEGQQLQEVTVVATRQTNTTVAVISEIREAQQVVSGISAEQIVRSQDRDAAEVVRRIPGVTVIDNRFINIRGLNERYNTVWLNDINAPSTETDRKSFSFDLLPSNLIDRVLIFKTTSPELPGDYAGGLVKVYTRKPVYNERSLSVSYTAGFRVGTTLNGFQKDKTSSLDFLGFGAKDRQAPSVTPTEQGGLYQVPFAQAQQFKNTYPLTEKSAIPDQRLNLSYLTGFKIGETSFGSLTAINYSNTFVRFTAKRGLQLGANGQAAEIQADDQSNNNVRLGIIQHFVMSLGSRGSKLEFRNLFNQIARNQVLIRDITETSSNQQTKQLSSLGYQSRSIYNGQLAGTHNISDKFTADWILAYGVSNKNEPDLRRSTYSTLGIATIQLPSPGQLDLFTASRLFQKLNENIATLNTNVKFKPTENLELATGTYIELKDRKYTADNYGYSPASGNQAPESIRNLPLGQVFVPANISESGLQIGVDPASVPSAPGLQANYNYKGKNKLYAAYLSGNVNFADKWKLLIGARYEHNIQSLEAADGDKPANYDVVTNKILPSLNLSYNLTEKSLIRAAYGRSLNRPEFREIAPGQYYDFDRSAAVYGSAATQSSQSILAVADIDNFDLRYEWYPSEGENVHFGVFYKRFTNPIEEVTINQTSNLAFSYLNAPSAYDLGAELDVRKNLNFIGGGFFKDLTFILNASYIQSRVDFKGTPNLDTWTDTRSLQGQSPYVVNLGLYYQSAPLGLQVSALYNVFGPRIIAVGSRSAVYPDIVEMPRHTVDLTITKNITERFSINAGAADILNARVLWVQDFERNNKYNRNTDPRLQDYRRGTYFTLGVRYNFF